MRKEWLDYSSKILIVLLSPPGRHLHAEKKGRV